MKKQSILVVDDNQDSLIYLCQIIDDLGYDVLLADRGASALSIVHNCMPDLILLDVQIPDIDSFEICKIIKQQPDLEDIPIMFLSASSAIDEKIMAFQVGGVDYIIKPYQKQELIVRLETHLKLSHYNRLNKQRTEELLLNNENELKIKNALLEANNLKLADTYAQLQVKEAKLLKVNAELSAAKELAERNERYFRELIERCPIPMIVTDRNRDIDFFNEKFTKEFGYSKADVSTVEKWWEIAYPNNTYRKQVQKGWVVAIDKALKENTEIDMQVWQMTIKDKTKRTCEFLMVPMGEKNLVVVNDITEKLAVQKELRYQNKELKKAKFKAEQSDCLKSAFLANMSHEIRTPMNAIVGFATFLLDPKKSREDLHRFARIIINSGNHLLNLINDIIDISKIDAGEVELSVQSFNLNETLDELFDFFHTKLVAKNKTQIVLRKKCAYDALLIKTDQTRLRQILINLIDNAIKFTEFGYVEFGYELSNNDLLFFVRDTGIGIGRNKLKVIFERFRQAEVGVEKRYGGTGLGLSIAKACVTLLDGKLWVESKKDEGTIFKFTIPYNNGGERIMEHKKELTAEIFNGESILLVEDDPIHVQYVKELLSVYNVNIIHVNNGMAAVERAVEKDVKMVLMDIQLPVLNGWEATTRIKRIRPNLPVIAQTAYAFEKDRIKSINAGCDAYLSKPIDCNKLIETMKNVFDSMCLEKVCS